MHQKHLSIEEIELLIQRPDEPSAEVLSHIGNCDQCRGQMEKFKEFDAKLKTVAAIRGAKTSECPSDRDWRDFAAGILTESENLRFLEHAADCAACVLELKRAARIFHAEITDDEQRIIDSIPIEPQRKPKPVEIKPPAVLEPSSLIPSLRPSWQSLGAIAALLVFALGGLHGYRVWLDKNIDETIDEAYRTGRPSEFCLAGVPYGRAPAKLGPAHEPRMVNLHGRLQNHERNIKAAFLAQDPGNALRLLQESYDEGDRSSFVLNNLAIAYVLAPAPSASQAPYEKALALIDDARTRYPNDAVAWFNRALILIRLGRDAEARESLNKFSSLTNDTAWLDEARQKLLLLP